MLVEEAYCQLIQSFKAVILSPSSPLRGSGTPNSFDLKHHPTTFLCWKFNDQNQKKNNSISVRPREDKLYHMIWVWNLNKQKSNLNIKITLHVCACVMLLKAYRGPIWILVKKIYPQSTSQCISMHFTLWSNCSGPIHNFQARVLAHPSTSISK